MKITVLMPIFNAAAFLAEAIESVLTQTDPDFELVLINDGSTDGSLQMMECYTAKDARITLISHDNCGMGESLNRGLEKSTTEWVARMDADDVMLPNRLTRQKAFLEAHPDVKVASCRAQYINALGKTRGKTAANLFTREKFRWYVDHHEAIGLLHPGVLMHRPTVLAIGGYRGQFWPAEDIDLWNRLAEAGHLILVQDEVLMHYRIHGGSVITSDFIAGRLKYEWVRACMHARRQGQPEPEWQTFQQTWHQDTSGWHGWNRRRKLYAKYHYRKAGYDWMLGKPLAAFGEMLLATALQPDYAVNRLRHQVTR